MSHVRPLLLVLFLCSLAPAQPTAIRSTTAQPTTMPAPHAYQNFTVAIYNPVSVTMQMKDPTWLQHSWDRLSSQVKIDKIYIENYRSRRFADDETLDAVKKFFTDHHVQVAGGMALDAGAIGGQFVSPCYTDPADRDMIRRASEQAARHFDTIILDDFFFNTTKSESDIKAKGDRSWTEFRLDLMNDVAENVVIKPAKAVNPNVKIIIKFPNWYEHFAGLGYDLQKEPAEFDAIYTGTETRDPLFSEQHLQAYESYEIIRYFDRIAPGRNLGGWVDPYNQRYIDRYAEQLWDTLLAKTPEITLFNYVSLLQPLQPGDRSMWQNQRTSFDLAPMLRPASPTTRDTSGPAFAGLPPHPDIARAAGYALESIDPLIGQLGNPIGIPTYRPPHALGEDFLPNFLGMIGVPLEMYSEFPPREAGSTVLLTESAKSDPSLISNIKQRLLAGDNVIITSGLLRAIQHGGAPGNRIEDIAEVETLDAKALVTQFQGPGGNALTPAALSPGILIPQVHFLTNDAWGLVMGVANTNGFPILLSDRYGKGQLFVLTIPDNFTDLYALPPEVLAALHRTILKDFPVRIDGPAQVALFAYDNHTFVVESFLPTPAPVTVIFQGSGLQDLSSTATLSPDDPRHPAVAITLPPHSYRAFRIVAEH